MKNDESVSGERHGADREVTTAAASIGVEARLGGCATARQHSTEREVQASALRVRRYDIDENTRFRARARIAVLKTNESAACSSTARRQCVAVTTTSDTWKHIPIVNEK